MVKLDSRDKEILFHLTDNCRQSNTSLAKKVRLSREVVSYRINRLEKEGVIRGYTADINFNKLGFLAYNVAFKLNGISANKFNLIVESMKRNKKIVYLQRCLGRYEFGALYLVRNAEELNLEMDSLRLMIGKSLEYIDIELFLGDRDFTASFLCNKTKQANEVNFSERGEYKISNADRKIIGILVKNSRISSVEISKKIGLSEVAIATRIKNLLRNKIIMAFKPIIDFTKLGYSRYALIINFFQAGSEERLINFCRKHLLIWDIGKYMGNYNYSIEIYARSNEEFDSVVKEINSSFSEEIISSVALMTLEELKHEYFYA